MNEERIVAGERVVANDFRVGTVSHIDKLTHFVEFDDGTSCYLREDQLRRQLPAADTSITIEFPSPALDAILRRHLLEGTTIEHFDGAKYRVDSRISTMEATGNATTYRLKLVRDA